MGKKTCFSQVKRAQIVKIYIKGYPERKIGAECNVRKAAVYIAWSIGD